uniref:Uncharacterized protein n=1 Tax=Beihai sipunculid worm virus 7 TaxID=1922679 RepID=A0A1L3KPC4_9VIRU|nr:hypothetical protein [Beihai sipunculid worm virus 7]
MSSQANSSYQNLTETTQPTESVPTRIFYFSDLGVNDIDLSVSRTEVVNLPAHCNLPSLVIFLNKVIIASPPVSNCNPVLRFALWSDCPTLFLEFISRSVQGPADWVLHTQPERLANFRDRFQTFIPHCPIQWVERQHRTQPRSAPRPTGAKGNFYG